MRLPTLLLAGLALVSASVLDAGDREALASNPSLLIDQGLHAEAESQLLEALRQERYEWAEPHLRRLVAARPNDALYLSYLGFCLLKRFDYAGAEQAYRRAVALDPQVSWKAGLARALHQQGQYAAALDLLTEVVADEPRPEYRYARATAGWSARKFDVVETEIRALQNERPDDRDAPCWLGRLLTELDRPGEGVPALRECIVRNPEDLEALYLLGLTQRRAGALGDAVSTFERVLERRPSHASAQYNLGRALLALGRSEEADLALRRFEEMSLLEDRMDALRDAIRMGPTKLRPRLDLASLLLEAGRPKEAQKEIEDALRIDPDNAEVRRLRDRIAQDLNRAR